MQKFDLLRRRVSETAVKAKAGPEGETVRAAPPGAVLDSALLVLRQRVEAICSEDSLGVLVGAKKLESAHQAAVDEAVREGELTFGKIAASADLRIRRELGAVAKVDRGAGMRPQHKLLLEEIDAYLGMEPLSPGVEDGTMAAAVWAQSLVSLLEAMGECSLADRVVRRRRRGTLLVRSRLPTIH